LADGLIDYAAAGRSDNRIDEVTARADGRMIKTRANENDQRYTDIQGFQK